ncbi:hypothetical protein V3W47_01740 [Deinococcus sp. YIM 134068]|uniref:hypothetical protein n=1 Tax=Deinococcus lichenicola TaxID=3118910 RepID=UPI002F949F02
MSPKRPRLGEVLRGTPAPPAEVVPASTKEKAGKMVQLNVTVPAELRKAVRLKALQEDRDVAEVVRELLTRWVDG